MKDSAKYTRKISPLLGLLGFLGLAGLLGIWSYRTDHLVYPFFFFGFFGFFGFYYEGKMSSTLMDERFLANKLRAERNAFRIGFYISFYVLVFTAMFDRFWIFLAGSSDPLRINETKLVFLTIVLAFTFALVMFLSSFLLYRYDHGNSEESEF